jgi:integrating conjugative element membrane protein (TIGR03747 family)
MASSSKNADSISQKALWPLWKFLRYSMAILLIFICSITAFFGKAYYIESRVERLRWADNMVQFYLNQSAAPEQSAMHGYWAYSLVFEWPQYVFRRMTSSTRFATTFSSEAPYSSSGSILIPKLKMTRDEAQSLAQRATYLFGVKLGCVFIAMPLIFLLLFVGATDGLVERYVRRKCVGHESSTWYHRFKRLSYTGLIPITAIFWLCIPIQVYAAWFLIPVALIFTVSLRFQIKYYKKYV